MQISDKALVAFACDNGQLVNSVNHFTEHFHIHSVTGLVYAETETTTDLLTLLRGAIAVFERTNLEHIRVIPTFTQSGVREDKTCRLVKGKETLLILQDKVVCRNIIRELRTTFECGVDTATCLFINAEIALVGISDFDATEILLIRSIKEGQIFVENSVVFFLKDTTILSEQFFAVLAILTILCNLVDEEQRQSFDTHFKELFFFLKVRLNSLSDLDSSHILLDHITDNLALTDYDAVGKGNCSTDRLNIGDNVTVLVLLHLIGLVE